MAIVHKKSTTVSDSIAVWESADKKWQVNVPSDGKRHYLGYRLGDRVLEVAVSDGYNVYYAGIYKDGNIVEDDMFQWRVPKKVRDATYAALKRAFVMQNPVKSASGRGKLPIRFIVDACGRSNSPGPFPKRGYFTDYESALKDAKKKYKSFTPAQKASGAWININKLTGGPYYTVKDIEDGYTYSLVKSITARDN